MIILEKPTKYLKYFDIPLENAREWEWKDYVVFIIETFWMTIFPFFAGMLLVSKKQILWIFMLILPIYFKIKIEQKYNQDLRRKRIFVR